MTLNELNELERQAKVAEAKAASAKRLQVKLANIRTGERPLMAAYKAMGAWDDDAKSAIEGIINEHGSDLLRIVELRQVAFARSCAAQASTHRLAITALLGEEKEDIDSSGGTP